MRYRMQLQSRWLPGAERRMLQEGRAAGCCEQAEGGSAGYVLHFFSLSVVHFPHRGAGDAYGI